MAPKLVRGLSDGHDSLGGVDLTAYRHVLRVPGLPVILALGVLVRVPMFAAGLVLTLHVVGPLGGTYAQAGVAALANTAAMALSGPWRGRLLDRVGLRRVLVPCLVVMAACWSVAPFVGYLPMVVLVTVAGLFNLPALSILRMAIMAATPDDRQRTALSLDSVVMELSFMAGPLLGVWAASHHSTSWVLFAFQMLGVAAGIAIWVADPPLVTPSAPSTGLEPPGQPSSATHQALTTQLASTTQPSVATAPGSATGSPVASGIDAAAGSVAAATIRGATTSPAAAAKLATTQAVPVAAASTAPGGMSGPGGMGGPGGPGRHAGVPEPRSWSTLPVAGVFLVAVSATITLSGTDLALVAILRTMERPELLGVVMSIWGVGSAVGGLLYGGAHRAVPASVLMLGLGLVTLPLTWANSVPSVAALAFVAGLFCAPTITATVDQIGQLVAEGSRGEAIGWHGSCMLIGGAVGAPLTGFAIDAGGAGFGFLVVAVLGMVGAAVAMVTVRRPTFRQVQLR